MTRTTYHKVCHQKLVPLCIIAFHCAAQLLNIADTQMLEHFYYPTSCFKSCPSVPDPSKFSFLVSPLPLTY